MTASLPTANPVTAALRASARRLVRVVLFSGLINVLTLSGSLYMLQVYDRVIPSRDAGTLVALSLMVLTAYVLLGYLDALRSRMLARIAALFDAELQGSLYHAIADLPLTGVSPAAFQQPLRDLDQVRAFLAGAGPTAFLDMPWMPVFFLVLFLFHPALGTAALAGAGAIICITLFAEHRSAARSRDLATAIARRQLIADATQTHADVIRALGMTGRFRNRWSECNEQVLLGSLQTASLHANLGAAGKVVRYALQSVLLGMGAYLVINGEASAGVMVASSVVMGRALAPVEVALATWRQLSAARTGLNRLAAALRPGGDWPGARSSRKRIGHAVSVRNLAVAAPRAPAPIVQGISFDLGRGGGLGLIGPSGSGKTSLIRGLTGIWPIQSGDVLFDGIDRRQWDVDSLGRQLGYLPQTVGLFEGTVFENIARFDPAATSDGVIDAASVSGAHEMIADLEEGYGTRIGPGGITLSAGQQQRIGLARAVFGNPFLVVLDEPNANLDAQGEEALTVAIRTLRMRGSAVLVVSHRPSALDALDDVMVLIGGRMLAYGPRAHVEQALRSQHDNRARRASTLYAVQH